MNRRRFAALALPLAAALFVAPARSGDDAGTGAATADDTSGATLRTVDVAEFHDLVTSGDDVTIIDVRTPAEFAEGHLAGAENIDSEAPDFADRVAELDPTSTYAIYCRSGNRSGQAMALMGDAGFTDVTNLDGGVTAWAAAGHPIE